MASESHRLSILSDQEIEDLYGFPQFDDDDRRLYFELSPAEMAAAGAITRASVAAFLILDLGYFKAKRQFFLYETSQIEEDLRFVVQHYFPGREISDFAPPSRPTRARIQRDVLDLFQFRSCVPNERGELESKAQRFAMLSTQPIYIFREILQHLSIDRIVAPSYSTLQDIVGRAVSGERSRLSELLVQALPPDIESHLSALINSDDDVFDISAIKREAKDFSYGELRREVARRDFFGPVDLQRNLTLFAA